jgi:16S rRNA (cytosine1402-N4)-methyltransferase
VVNNELDNLQKLLDSTPQLLKKDGKVAIISFHSLEDRIVKNNFKQNETKDIYKLITKKPVEASREEININRRARSAKLRIAQKI